MISFVRKNGANAEDVVKFGIEWLNGQSGTPLVLGTSKRSLGELSWYPSSAIVRSRRSRRGEWRGGPILMAWVRDPTWFEDELELATEVMFLQWIPKDGADWLLKHDAREVVR